MTLRIRLSRTGKKNAPSFRIVVIDSRRPRNGRPIETLGHYNPSHRPPTFSCDKKRVDFWVKRGTKISKPAEALLARRYKFKPYKPGKRGEEKSEGNT